MATVTLRNYLTIAELDAKANITVTNDTEALRQIDRAEQAVDDYVGYQCKSVQNTFRGQVSSYNAGTKTIVDTNSNSQLHVRNNYFIECVVEIVGGTGAGQIGLITASSYDNFSLTLADAFATALDTTSMFKVYQLAKFPRQQDIFTSADGLTYYKSVPQQVKDAVAAQVEFQIAQGNNFFEGDESDITSETIGNYSYSKGQGASGFSSVTQFSPRARAILRGIKNSTGVLLAENPTEIDTLTPGLAG